MLFYEFLTLRFVILGKSERESGVKWAEVIWNPLQNTPEGSFAVKFRLQDGNENSLHRKYVNLNSLIALLATVLDYIEKNRILYVLFEMFTFNPYLTFSNFSFLISFYYFFSPQRKTYIYANIHVYLNFCLKVIRTICVKAKAQI